MKKEIIKAAKTVSTIIKKNSPTILAGTAIVGVGSTAILSSVATKKSMEDINDLAERGETEPTKAEIIKTCWVHYVPAVISGVGTIACIIGGQAINGKRLAAMSSLYAMSETALKEYKEEATKLLGEKKASAIKDAINKNKVDANPPKDGEIILANKDGIICYESISGRYFKAQPDTIKAAENELNRTMITGDSRCSVNDWYYQLGIPGTKYGDEMGWTVDCMLETRFTSSLMDDATPVLVIDYVHGPFPWYRDVT